MNRYIQKRVTLVTDENGYRKIYFDFYDKTFNFIGNIIVSEKGRIEWHVIDALYMNDILDIVCYFIGGNNNLLLDYKSKSMDLKIWKKAIVYIINSGLYLNYKEDDSLTLKKYVKNKKYHRHNKR